HRSVQIAQDSTPEISVYYKLSTESAQSRGPENIDPERPLQARLAPGPVLRPTRITLENNGKIRPQPDGETPFARANGGERRSRAPETVPRLLTFQAYAFDHSATSPWGAT